MPRRPKHEQPEFEFSGFERPESNYFKMPNDWIDLTAQISNVAELKVVQYILRHTWGYHEYDIQKHITVDEFSRGRRRNDGSRMDMGTGLSERAVRYGLQAAVAHRLVEETIDDTDRGRTKKYYSLRMNPRFSSNDERQDLQSGVQSLHPGMQTLPPSGADFAPRSEKDTQERNIINSKLRRTSSQKDSSTETDQNKTGARHTSTPTTSGMESAGQILKRRTVREPIYDEDRDRILAYLQDISRLLNDQAPLKSSVSRAYRLYKRSGKPIGVFCELMYQARGITQEHSGSIRSQSASTNRAGARKAKMAYFFSVLADLLGLKPPEANATYPDRS